MEDEIEMPVNSTTTFGLDEDESFRRLQECLRILNTNATSLPEPYCPGVFDGWVCWPSTPGGKEAFAPCPAFVTGFDPSLIAHKICEPNGSWFRHPETNSVWSNYTTCVNTDDLHWAQQLNIIYEIGYTISLIALIVSLGILSYFRTLRCARITLHMNLFASFAVNNALWLIWYAFIVTNTDLLMENGISCRLLHIILHYFLLTNYAWMLCEGFYLHTILVNAFTSEHNLVKWLMAIGWPAPALVVLIYASLRFTSDDPIDNLKCWIDEGNFTNVLVYPVCVSTFLNLLFLFNIVRVLLTKLRAGPAIGTRPSRSILQAFRATLLLVPLLGLHYLVVPFRPPKGHSWEKTHDIVSAVTASFQGLCVAILFCFCNGEVIAQFKRKWEGSVLIRKRANSCTATTVSVRWRERRRCDYQTELPMEEKLEKLVINNHNHQQHHLHDNKDPRDNDVDEQEIIIKHNDSTYDLKQYQTQC
ncbi:calcitonin gene-related peptide type 1 receptor-like isoform X1 [Microplitis mediator]|uniref:calcitonin gene-related peptide type 1 receptor-like isoform X1 n=2 Tax=Microplitis mediator TaxID=375433 RepID=UPI002555327F|nr:calcitonin gene-related peptide type 1 receptor-like isoform X1 [Microplitis mediator]XP_057336622.1 calcitonin gene-related peptide type 1 receptor-like isoform X1 [Microplitis mediator]